jgi:glycosyltransferase involved in cell wall biosynthesis
VVIPNGIDSDAFTVSPKEKTILSSGRLLARKGFIQLVQAAKALPSSYTVHILGEGPVRNQLEALAKESTAKVVLHGWVDNRSVKYKQLLSSASIYCLVSEKENASISILEAMASGCAVITSDQSGCPEMVGDAGVLVPFDQPEKLAHAIQELIKNPQIMSDLGNKARKRALTTYDWNSITGTYLELLHEIKTKRKS